MHAHIPKKEREYFIENLSMLLSSNMGVSSALSAIEGEIQSHAGKIAMKRIHDAILEGVPLSQIFSSERLFTESAIALIRMGEQSGTLPKSIEMVATEETKNKLFRSRIRSAMIYPVFILILACIVGIGIAWFILPKLSRVFDQMRVTLPPVTRALMSAAAFLETYGVFVIPIVIGVIGVFFYFLFVFSKTKKIGEMILLSFPGISKFIIEIQIAQFASTLGILLRAGLPISDSIRALQNSAFFFRYKKLFLLLELGILEGKTISSVLDETRLYKLIPRPVVHIIRAGEQSGSLPESLLKIGMIFESKTEISTKNFAVLIEPVLLVLVWFGVLFVALAVFLPLYSLLGGIK